MRRETRERRFSLSLSRPPARWGRNDWLLFSGAALSVGALALFDRQAKEEFRRVEERNDDRWARVLSC